MKDPGIATSKRDATHINSQELDRPSTLEDGIINKQDLVERMSGLDIDTRALGSATPLHETEDWNFIDTETSDDVHTLQDHGMWYFQPASFLSNKTF
jgi:hypothetical protein